MLHGLTLASGLGRIGVAVAQRLVPFGVSSILYHGRTEKPEAAASIGAGEVGVGAVCFHLADLGAV